MLWFKVESEIVAHRKTRLIPRTCIEAPTRTAAMGVWLFAAAWSAQHESDGFVPGEEFERWDPNGDLTPYLVEVGYLEDATVGGERGYALHDWLDVQRSRADIESDRAKDAEKKQRMRASKAAKRPPHPDDDGPEGLPLDIPDYVPTGVPGGHVEGHPNGHPLGTPEGNPERVFSLEQSRVREERSTKNSPAAPRRGGPQRQKAGSEFEAFYAAYPRKKEPEDAAKAWLQVRKFASVAEIMAAVARYTRETKGWPENRKKYPASWLRGGGWASEPDRPARASGSGLMDR